MDDPIVVEGVGKRFYHLDPRRSMTLQELWAKGFKRPARGTPFWALQDVSFRVPRGQMVGIVGRNGAGKSTLLRLLVGIARPHTGRVIVRGQMGTLLELSAGYHPDLTGRENIFVNGVISGLTRREVAARFDSIVEFAELADFIDDPLRSYSTGMQMRLAFSVSLGVHRSEPEVLVVDEVLAVGDYSFQGKCIERMRQLRSSGCTIVLASHSMSFIGSLCDRALWLDGGRLVADGSPADVLPRYLDEPDPVVAAEGDVDPGPKREAAGG